MKTTPMTVLDAVNIILDNDGEAPIASLDETGFGESARALARLEEVSRSFQEEGWAFNTDLARKFSPDATKEIVLPSNTLTVSPVYLSKGMAVIERGRKLYDLSNNTYQFNQPIYLNVVQMLDFEDMPSAARYLVAVRAARIFQSRGTGSYNQNSFTAQDETRAVATWASVDWRMRKRTSAPILPRRPI